MTKLTRERTVFGGVQVAMKVSQWGNSLAIRLPKTIIDELELKAGDELQAHAEDDDTIIIRKPNNDDGIDQTLDRLKKFRGMIPAGYQFQRKDAYE